MDTLRKAHAMGARHNDSGRFDCLDDASAAFRKTATYRNAVAEHGERAAMDAYEDGWGGRHLRI